MAKKQKSGLYRSKVRIGVDAEGKEIVKYISGKTKRELEQARQEVERYYIHGTGTEADRLFGVYAQEWYRLRKAPLISTSTQASYQSMFNKHLLPAFAERNLRAIRSNELQEWLNKFALESSTTIALAATVIRGVFDAATADRIVEKNPAEYLILPKAAKPTERRALTDDETQAIKKVITTHERGDYLATLYYLGLRPGEGRGLQWGDFDWDADLVHIQRDLDYTSPRDPLGALKTPAADRYIPIPDELRALLFKRRGLPDALVFVGARSGDALSKSSAERLWIELMIEAGLATPKESTWKNPDVRAEWTPTITPYYLRHNFITLCWEAGLDPLVTMRLAGHADYRTTMNVYAHLNKEHLKKAQQDMRPVFEKKLHKSCTSGSGQDRR